MLGKPKESRHGTMPPPRPWPGDERGVVAGGRMGGGSGRQGGQLAGHNSWPASVQFEACLLPK